MPGNVNRKPEIAVLGPGAVGSALALGLSEAGYHLSRIVARRLERARALSDRVPDAVASDRISDLPGTADFVFVAVSDDAILPVASRLAAEGGPWEGTIVAHVSGLHTGDALEPLRRAGAHALSFHPLQTFAGDGAATTLQGITIALEGDAEALEPAGRIAEDLGARPFRLPTEDKALYHLGATVASNFLVTLLAVVEEIFHAMGRETEGAVALVAPLVERTWRNLVAVGPEQALTGPIVRGDLSTTAAHMEAIRERLPHLAPFFVALAAETVRLAVRSGRLPAARAEQLLDRLADLVTPGGET